MSICLDDATLTALTRGELPTAAAAVAERHAETCTKCARRLAELNVDAELVPEIRSVEQARRERQQLLAQSEEIEKRISTTLFGTNSA